MPHKKANLNRKVHAVVHPWHPNLQHFHSPVRGTNTVFVELEETTGIWFQLETFFPIDTLRKHVYCFCSLALNCPVDPHENVEIKVLAAQKFAIHFLQRVRKSHCQARFVKTLFSLDHLLFWWRNLGAKQCTHSTRCQFAWQMFWCLQFLCLFWVSYSIYWGWEKKCHFWFVLYGEFMHFDFLSVI